MIKKRLKKKAVRRVKSIIVKKAITKKKTSEKGSTYDRIEEDEIAKILNHISTYAKRKAFRNNAPITVIREGKIIKIYKNNKTRKIGEVKRRKNTEIPTTKLKIR